MELSLRRLTAGIENGNALHLDEACRLACDSATDDLMAAAEQIRLRFHGSRFHTCAIINARSGGCGEDCSFCGQSARHANSALSSATPIASDEALGIAGLMERHGVERLSLVTSGRAASSATLTHVGQLTRQVRARGRILLCASLGLLDSAALRLLPSLGIVRYHCNLETSASYFPRICTSHSFDDKRATLLEARRQGLSLCSGGIIGLGESMEQRLEMAAELQRLAVDSVPINLMTPLPGTPLAESTLPTLEEILRSIAIYRLMLPRAVLRMAGGRQQLGASQYRCFQAGANGAIVGNYLTTRGNPLQEDLESISAMGYVLGAG